MDKKVSFLVGGFDNRFTVITDIRLHDVDDGIYADMLIKTSEMRRITKDELKQKRVSTAYWGSANFLKILGVQYGIIQNADAYCDYETMNKIKQYLIEDETTDISKLITETYLPKSVDMGDNTYVYFHDHSTFNYLSEFMQKKSKILSMDLDVVKVINHIYNNYGGNDKKLPNLWVRELSDIMDKVPKLDEQTDLLNTIAKDYVSYFF